MNTSHKYKPVFSLNNFKQSIPFLFSAAANIGLGLSKIVQIDYFLVLVFAGLLLFSFFHSFAAASSSPRVLNPLSLVIAVLLEALLLIHFCDSFSTGRLANLITSFGIPPQLFFCGIGCVLCFLGLRSAYDSVLFLLDKLRPLGAILKSMRKQYAIIAVVFCLGITAIVRANYYYVDDMGRTLLGYQLTGDFSRYLATLSSTLLHGNMWLTDISPLTQYLSALIMALAAVILIYVLSGNSKSSFWVITAVIPLGLCPYFLECYSYKFDAPYMAFSVLMAIVPLVYRRYNPIKYGSVVAVGTLAVCLTYQASSGIFPMLVVLIAFLMWTQKESTKQIAGFILSSAVGYLIGMFLFAFVLLVPVASDNYVGSSLSLLSILSNCKQYFLLIVEQFHVFWLILIGVIIIAFVWSIFKSSKQPKTITTIMAIVAFSLMTLLMFGVYIALEKPSFAPRAMYGIGILIASLGIIVATKEKIPFGKIAIIALGWQFFVFSFTYGNALSIQKEYTDFRMQQVLTDLNDLPMLSGNDKITIQIDGSIGQAPAVENMSEEYTLLKKMVTVQFRDSSWPWGDYWLTNYYGASCLITDDSIDLAEYDLPVLTDSMYHTIRGNDNYIYIELK